MTKDTSIDVTERPFAFQDLTDLNAPWREVLSLGRKQTYKKGQQVGMGPYLYFLDSGKIRLSHISLQGLEKILWYLHPGSLFGETPFFDRVPAAGYFHCSTDCVVYSFSHQVVEQLARERPELILDLCHSMARKMRALSDQASSLFLDSLKVRTVRFLAQHVVKGTDPMLVDLGITKQELAALLGVHRISLYKILKDYEDAGVLSPFHGSQVTILRPEAFFQAISGLE